MTTTTDGGLPHRAFGTLHDGGPHQGAAFTPRSGPAASPWADVLAGGPAPSSLSAAGGTLASTTGYYGPDVVAGGRAIAVVSDAMVATDLDTGGEAWRATGASSLASALMATDGEHLCGFGLTTFVLTCLSMSDGHLLFTAPGVTTFLSGASPDNATEIVFHGDAVYVRATQAGAVAVAAFDLATGTERFSVPADATWRSIVFAGDDLLVVDAAGVHALDPTTGVERASRASTGAMLYLLQTGGEAIYVPGPGSSDMPVAYATATRTFRDAPEWAALAGAGGLSEPLSDGSALALLLGGSPTRIRYDVATRTPTTFTPAQIEMRYRAHPNVLMVWVPGSGPSGFDLSPGATPVYAFFYESWGFQAGGAFHAIP